MKINFCGAAEGVTGSCHMISSGDKKILLDCGQFQGGKSLQAMNFQPFPFEPSEIDCLVLSHAHIDHCGRIPLLVKRGFRGNIYCTDATADLLEIMLRDSGYIHEKEAEWQSRKNLRKGLAPVEPLYNVADAENSLKYIKPILYDQLVEINDSMRIVFNDAGHILGSAIIELWIYEDGKTSKIVFSGDLGVADRPILRNPTKIKKADAVIMETTYGNRVHPDNAMGVERLIDIIIETKNRGGTVVIPSFAVGRTQELIYQLNKYYDDDNKYRNELRDIPVYIDSPMATNATEVFRKNAQVFDDEMREYILRGDDPLDFYNLKFTKTTEESRKLNENRNPKVIISASGMCEAGRIRHHLKHNLWDEKCSVVFVGFQGEGTLGRQLINGAEEVTLFGETIKVNAKIHNLEGFSGHADREGLMNWLSGFVQFPKQVFLVHGESQSKRDFAEYVEAKLNHVPVVVERMSQFDIIGGNLLSMEETMKGDIDEEAIDEIKERIWTVHGLLEKLLYDTSLAVDEEMCPEKVTDINNALISLEKGSLTLGSALSSRAQKIEE